MAKSAPNPARFDPYKDFKFRLKWDAKGHVAGVSRMSALTHTEPVKQRERESSFSRVSPGRAKYEAITMERGVTYDRDFEQWANGTSKLGNGPLPAEQRGRDEPPKDLRRNLTIDVFDEAGRKVISYKVHRAWVSKFTAQANLDTSANAMLIESITIEHEGCEAEKSE